MPEKFFPFHTFSDPELANDFVEKLESIGIVYEVENVRKILDTTIGGYSSDPDIIIKLKPEDFSKANQYLEDYYKSQVENIDKDYYLFSFSDNELLEIVSKPDEWNYLDYALAQKLLNERGLNVDAQYLQKLKSDRKKELSKIEHPGFFLYFIAYLFITCGLISLISPITATFYYYDLNFLTPIISFFIGRHLYRSKRVLPDGLLLFNYSLKNRNYGKIIMYMGLIIFIGGFAKYLIFSFINL